mgnify:CR=1 FL=1
MNILVIGNGFDLAHGLPTSYMNFLEFIEKYKEYNDDSLVDCDYNNITVYFKNLKENKSGIYNEISSLINENRWVQHFLKLKEKDMLESSQTWIDFESEISKVIQTLDKLKRRFKNDFYSETNKVRLDEYEFEVLYDIFVFDTKLDTVNSILFLKEIEIVTKKLIEDLNRLVRCLEIYLVNYVSNEYFGTLKKKEFITNLKIDKILSFNYTNTYKRLYGSSHIEFNYIHGMANNKHDLNSCDLILGIDEYLKDNEKNQYVDFIQFKKFYQRIYKGTRCLYKEWLETFEISKKKFPKSHRVLNIYFIGHSLDVTDKDILKELILCDGANTTVYYHDQEALGRMISNLVKVIGEDELIRRTGGSKATINFVQQPNCGDKYD